MRLQDDGVTLHRAPATRISVAHFHKVNRTLELRTPCSIAYLVLGFVYLHETARRKNGIHREIFRSNIPIGVPVVRKLRQIRQGHNTPLLDGASQVRRFLERESWIEPRRHPHLCEVARSFGQVRLLRMPRTNVRRDAIEFEAIEGQQLPIFPPIDSGERIEPENTRDYAFGFNVGQAAGWNCEFLTLKSLRDLTTGQFHVPHTIS